eukprot:SAG22_NODE_5826_length_945_cov_4.139315_2_plen_124_part_00
MNSPWWCQRATGIFSGKNLFQFVFYTPKWQEKVAKKVVKFDAVGAVDCCSLALACTDSSTSLCVCASGRAALAAAGTSASAGPSASAAPGCPAPPAAVARLARVLAGIRPRSGVAGHQATYPS